MAGRKATGMTIRFKLWLIPLLATGLAVFAFSATSWAISPSTLIDLTNQQRSTAGLPPLKENPQLMASAEAKAENMLANNYWAHVAPDGTTPWYFISQSGYDYSRAGENLAMDFTTDEDLMTSWMNSPEHRANILNPNYLDIGIAVVNGTLLGEQTTLVVAHYGTPAGTPDPAPVPATITPPVAAAPVPVASTASAPAPTVNQASPSAKPRQQPATSKDHQPATDVESPLFSALMFSLFQAWLLPLFKYQS